MKYLGVNVGKNLSFKSNLTAKCKETMRNLMRLKHLHNMLTREGMVTLVMGLAMSYLDYSNALYAGLPECDINKMQRVQNIAAKVVLGRRKMDSATTCLKELHWLPVRSCICCILF